VIYGFILDHTQSYPVEKMCKVLLVSKSAYYCWKLTIGKPQVQSNKEVMKKLVVHEYEQSHRIYGSPRIAKTLQQNGKVISQSYVARLMQEMKLKSVLRKKFVVTTDSKHNYKTASNLLDRNFTETQLGKKWVSDITYLKVGKDWAYLTTMIDLADRKVVGWSLSTDMTVENTVLKAWNQARNQRDITLGFMLHSDRGIQYACHKTGRLFENNIKAVQSMSRKGNCWDNAVAESFFKTIKYEWIYRNKYYTYEQAYLSIWKYINWYNNHRLHSALDYKTPAQMEHYLKNINNKSAA
jgi:transposase InsO family protein